MRFNRKVSKNEQNGTKLKQTLVVKLMMTLVKKGTQLLGTNSHILSWLTATIQFSFLLYRFDLGKKAVRRAGFIGGCL